MQFTKHHGLGNDFLVSFVDAVPDHPEVLAVDLCHRHTGVGADGVIFASPPPAGAGPCDVSMTLFNADGSAAELSGNGLRCLGQAIARHHGLDAVDLTAFTVVGPRRITGTATPADPNAMDLTVEMGVVGPGADLDPHAEAIHAILSEEALASADIGNPHVVAQVADPAAFDLAVVGPAVESLVGPTNLHLVAPGPVPGEITMQIWERGAGVTAACGTGACVVAHVAHRWGIVGDEVTVHMPGGEARVSLGDVVRLGGPTVFVAEVETP